MVERSSYNNIAVGGMCLYRACSCNTVHLVVMLSAARQTLPSRWDSGATEGLESLGGDEDGNIVEEGNGVSAGGGAAAASGLGRFEAGADACAGGAAAKHPNISSSMA